MLQQHNWPGNVRELENTILQAMIVSKNDVLEKENIILINRFKGDTYNQEENLPLTTLAELEKNYIQRVLDFVNWNKLEASRILDISRPTLNAKIEKYKLIQ